MKDKILSNKKYTINSKYSSRGELIYYYILDGNSKNNEINEENKNLEKIYLNCERKDIADLANEVFEVIKNLKDCPLKIGFVAEDNQTGANRAYQRNDKIVIYTASAIDKERIMNAIMQLKIRKPKLFSDKKELPLMPKTNGFIGVTKQGENRIVTPLYEKILPSSSSTYEGKLSVLMEDCLTASIMEVSESDEELFNSMAIHCGEDTQKCLTTFKAMDTPMQERVTKKFKELLVESCKKSNLDISYKGKETECEKHIEDE